MWKTSQELQSCPLQARGSPVLHATLATTTATTPPAHLVLLEPTQMAPTVNLHVQATLGEFSLLGITAFLDLLVLYVVKVVDFSGCINSVSFTNIYLKSV